jgi:ubiquinone/menaquinone biosynthesis C-methylase UbiE
MASIVSTDLHEGACDIMNTKESIYKAYDDAADEYAKAFWNEIETKNLDCLILKWLSDQVPSKEGILEIGSGPGEVTGYLSKYHTNCIGTDQSKQMIQNAKKYYPLANFQIQDFYRLDYADNSFAAVVAFYAIVNLTIDEIERVFKEVERVLKSKGIFLFTFHLAEESKEIDVKIFFKKENSLRFYLYGIEEIKSIVEIDGFEIVDIITRYPYKEEHPTKRVYFIARKK